ncbi:PHD finger protein rhinoceros [Hylaeus anthracinus]|uniref:PHD finger protein rhinoceros n=1 Tax=Hylaeus anthracinus TaxID=313031 RepID=UPI0023B9D7D6|nr:PHD finger protein rhinoceros [Hylaeus anthracinus]
MAQRGKRINRNDNDLASCPGAIKRRKCRLGPATGTTSLAATMGPSEEEETMASSSQGGASWTPRPLSDIKISSIYNRSSAEAPAELFRKDLISAMKLPDSEPLSPNEYWVITDQWKQEWERGVQVPVNPDSLPEPTVTITQAAPVKQHTEFKLPKKFVRISRDDYFSPEDHHLSTTPARAEKACAYDLDDTDIAWLDVLNGERAQSGQLPITETQLERVIEELEVRCWERIQTIVKNEEGLGIEYDENVICDVCRSPDSEEGNEMVFCDCCNICVHQACYGITSIPDGSWLCRTCSLSQRPDCVLCPNKGGAMKCTRSGQKWAHVSCALWIPEVSIGCVERMEPITKISSIPQSRWALICVLCRERVGACIQCSIKTCKTAYHVTCAFKYGLEMKAIIEDEMADDGVKLRSYCQKHSRTNTKDKVQGAGGNIGSGAEKAGSDSEDAESRRRKRKDMTSEEKNQARAAKLQEIEAEFDKHVSLKDIASQQLDVDPEGIVYIYNYWKLKRRAGHNKPLLAPRCGELSGSGSRNQGQAADLEKMRTFVQLRQDLERVRNLCYMVGRREKLCRSFLRLREQTFHKQALVMSGPPLPSAAAAAVMEANHGPSIYDRLYSHPDSEDHTHDFDLIVARIAGIDSPTSDEKKPQQQQQQQPPQQQQDFNGASSKKLYFNGSVRRKNLYGSDLSSVSSSETDATKVKTSEKSKNLKLESESSTEEETNVPSKTKLSRRKTKKTAQQVDKLHSTLKENSENEKLVNSRSHTLQHMEKELGSASGSESDELLPLSAGGTKHVVASAIYSDTDSDSQEHASHSAVLITKAAVKEFSAANLSKNSQKSFGKDSRHTESTYHNTGTKNKENQSKGGAKKKEYIPSALIVPQRQAAKKASEIMQRTQQTKKDNSVPEVTSEAVTSPVEELPKCSTKQSKEKSPSKKQRENKPSKETKNNDVYDFDKEFGDGTEILAYVPQRQAAKKAAEHIKSGMGTKPATQIEQQENPDGRSKKESPESGKRKEPRKEDSSSRKDELPLRKEETSSPSSSSSCCSSSSSSSSSSCSSSSSSSSRKEVSSGKEELVAKKEEPSSKKEEVLSKDNCSRRPRKPSERKSVLSSNSDSNSSSNSCSSSTGSSSDSESPARRRLSNELKEASASTTSSESDAGNRTKTKTTTTMVAAAANRKQHPSKTSPDQEADKKPISGRKLKKLPEKKLKTSDGRRGPEFQPPSEREEPRRTSKDQHQQQKQQQQQEATVKKQDQRDNKKQQPPAGTEGNEDLLTGAGDHDGSRSVSGSRPTKKSSQAAKQQSLSRKEDNKNKSEGRKRKPNESVAKDEKKETVKKPEKRLSEKQPSKETEKKDEEESRKDEQKVIDLEKSDECTDSSSKNDEKKVKKLAGKDAVNILEEEMKQRRAERDSPKKSSRGLDKLLEKREHLDKMSKSKNAEVKQEMTVCEEEKEEKEPVEEIQQPKESIKDEDRKNHVNEGVNTIIEKPKVEEQLEEEAIKKDIAEAPQLEKTTCGKKKSERSLETTIESQTTEILVPVEENLQKEIIEEDPAKSVVDKIETLEKEHQKRRKSGNRSIFSPQHGKDPSVSELFDFDQDMLTEEMVNEDGFGISRDPEERAAPLSFSFNNELWFKEDSKEDSARETLHLVEKLRMELSKKSNSSQFELEAVPVDSEIKKEDPTTEKAFEQQQLQQQQQHLQQSQQQQHNQQLEKETKILEPAELVLDAKNSVEMPVEEVAIIEARPGSCKDTIEEKRKTCYTSSNDRYTAYEEDRETNKVSLVERSKLDRAETDERWVPPSINSFEHSDVQHLNALMETQNHRYGNHQFSNESIQENESLTRSHLNAAAMQEQYLLQQPHTLLHGQQESHERTILDQQIPDENPMEMMNRHLIGLPASEDDQAAEMMDRVLEKEDDVVRQQEYDQNSPYNDVNGRPDTRWAESQVLPSRRSTSSSITSASSAEDHSIPPFKNVPSISFPPCSMEPTYYADSSYGTGPVSLFPPQSCAAPLPYPSPGPALFPPAFGAAFPAAQSLLPHVKPLEDSLNLQASPCTAAFTSSSHNMALTAAMVSPTKIATPPPPPPPPPPQVAPPVETIDRTQQQPQTQVTDSPSLPINFLNTVAPESHVADPIVETLQEALTDNKTQHPGKKSPSKPTRTSARVTSLQGKSPGKSPRQEPQRTVSGARGRGRGAKSSAQHSSYRSRGRGRGRGRGRSVQNAGLSLVSGAIVGQHDDSIQNKLVGTVYDFDSDEDSTSEANIADLRTMRERKKSTDAATAGVERRDTTVVASEAVQTKLSSPGGARKYLEDRRLSCSPGRDDSAIVESESNAGQSFDAVLPLIPGPVDMRTYNSTLDASSSSTLHGQTYENHFLRTFTSVSTSDPALPDIEEDLDKELRLIGKQGQEDCSKPSFDASIDASSSGFVDANKVSLTDSRNQLKVKIKGPFLDANYVPASSVPPLAQQAPVIIAPAATSASVASGTSNLRRMRKKELLRQYCSQDMNMDEPGSGNLATSAPIIMPPINRTVITIPKAVASMTSIPTREDYKAVVDANMEKKRRKERPAGFLDANEEEGPMERRRGSATNGASSSGNVTVGNTDRRRGRQSSGGRSTTTTTSTTTTNSGPPKLKIKIGNSIIGGQETGQDDRTRIRPPKKRLSSIPSSTPSIEELRRESMKFRRMIMAGFDNDEKLRAKSKKDKNGKRKKRQSSRKEARVRILEGGAAPPKLIIRLGKGNDSPDELPILVTDEEEEEEEEEERNPTDSRVGPPPPEPAKDETVYPAVVATIEEKQPTDPNTGGSAPRNVRSAKVTPIRLKLTRCQEGYELKGSPVHGEESASTTEKPPSPEPTNEETRDPPVKNQEEDSSREEEDDEEEESNSNSVQRDSTACPAATSIPQGCQVR